MFAPLDPPKQLTPLKKPKLKLPYTGVARYISEFAEPDDPEYEPELPAECPPSPRLFANPELKVQARVENESIYERCAAMLLEFQCHDHSSENIPNPRRQLTGFDVQAVAEVERQDRTRKSISVAISHPSHG